MAKALDRSLQRWVALTRFTDGRQLTVDSDWNENPIRSTALAGSLREPGAAAVLRREPSACVNKYDSYAHLKDGPKRLHPGTGPPG